MTTHFLSTRSTLAASLITALNVLIASGFAIAGLVSPACILPANAAPNRASFIFALYAAARTLPLAAMTLATIAKGSAANLTVLGLLAGAVQLADAAVGVFQDDPSKIFGPLFIAALQFYAVYLFKKSAEQTAT
jgi:hypothetical protein